MTKISELLASFPAAAVDGTEGIELMQGGSKATTLRQALSYGWTWLPKPSGDTTGATDTAAILAALGASTSGVLRAHAGTYRLRGASNGGAPITIPGTVGLVAAGDGWAGGAGTTFLCIDATAGLKFDGGSGGICEGFVVDGNSIATKPLQRTAPLAGGGYRTWRNVAAVRSAADNWTILGVQNDLFVNVVSSAAGRDGYYVDNGTSGHTFLNLQAFGSTRYNIHGNALITTPTPPAAGPAAMRFLGGNVEIAGSTSHVYLRSCADWTFEAVPFGGGCTGPSVDIDSTCSLIRFPRCTLTASVTGGGASPGFVCVKMNGGEYCDFSQTYFNAGDTSIHFAALPSNPPQCAGMIDFTTNKAVVASGLPAAPTLQRGLAGPWITPTLGSGWTNVAGGYPVQYRITPAGQVQLRGSAKGTSATTAFTLPLGYRSPIDAGFLMSASGGSAQVVATTTGVVLGYTQTGDVSVSLNFDGVAFSVLP